LNSYCFQCAIWGGFSNFNISVIFILRPKLLATALWNFLICPIGRTVEFVSAFYFLWIYFVRYSLKFKILSSCQIWFSNRFNHLTVNFIKMLKRQTLYTDAVPKRRHHIILCIPTWKQLHAKWRIKRSPRPN